MPRTRLAAPRGSTVLVAASRALSLAALLGACADGATAPRSTAAAPPPSLAIVDASRGGEAGFHWLTPTVATQPASFPGPFDPAAAARLAVELCRLDAAGTACVAAPVARYTAQTQPYAQQLRADAPREFFLVYWNTAANTAAGAPLPAAGQTYRARVLDGARELGRLDVKVVATAAEANAVDRSRYAAVVRGQQLALRFRVEQQSAAEEPVASQTLVDEVARGFYDVIASDAGAAAREQAVLDIFGQLIRVVPPAEAGELETLRTQGVPFALAEQLPTMARGFAEGALVDVDNFVAAANAAGARTQDGAPLTAAYLAQGLSPVLAMQEHRGETILPAMVMALGRERARRAGGLVDPVWGDGKLDPLQATLLMYAFHFSKDQPAGVVDVVAIPAGVRASAAVNAPAVPKLPSWVPKSGPLSPRIVITGRIGKLVEMPLTWGQAATSSICASILMNSYEFSLFVNYRDLERRHARATKPGEAIVTATLTFDFTPNETAKKWLDLPLVGCQIPANGTAAGKTVKWTVNAPLTEHGALTQSQTTTDASGRARATYLTVNELVPHAFQQGHLQQSATGTIDVRATGLVPGWSNLERSIGVGVLNPTDAGVRLTVGYWEFPKLRFTMTSRIRYAELFHTGYTADIGATVDLLPNATAPGTYYGEGSITRAVATPGVDRCPGYITSLGAPNPYQVGIAPATAEGDGINVFVNMPYWTEQWMVGHEVNRGCEFNAGPNAAGYGSAGWIVTHENELSSGTGWLSGGRRWIVRMPGWTNPSPGVYRKTYDRTNAGVTEQSTIEVRVVP